MTRPTYTLHHGDCLDVLRGMADASVDSVVTDPPYGLSDHKPAEVVECLKAWLAGEPYTPKGKGFMGKGWDAWVPGPEVWRECLRVLKPGGHLLSFAGTRSMDLMCMSVRLAGFELRDSIGHASDGGDTTQAPIMAWTFGSGFPKSMDVSKAIDKAAGVDREVVGEIPDRWTGKGNALNFSTDRHQDSVQVLGGPATDAAKQWQGWGTALKPAWEPIILARKPLIGTVAANVLAHGTGGMNIDGCRVGDDAVVSSGSTGMDARRFALGTRPKDYTAHQEPSAHTGRWPANLLHDGSPEVVALFPVNAGASAPVRGTEGSKASTGNVTGERNRVPGAFHADTGSAARFFYCAKASKGDRDEGLDDSTASSAAVLDHRPSGDFSARMNRVRPPVIRKNNHPTVKPTDLMRYLCRLVTPPGGIVLDPFTGSGSTGKAAILEGFRFIGAEREAEYIAIARARIEAAMPADQLELQP